jgi:hypothetical protein
MSGFMYLATPYTKYPDGTEAAFKLACQVAAKLVDAGFSIYCPIAHTHPIAQYTKADPLDSTFWIKADRPLMTAAKELWVVKMQGWQESSGIAAEINYFTEMNKRVLYLDPTYPLTDLGDQL